MDADFFAGVSLAFLPSIGISIRSSSLGALEDIADFGTDVGHLSEIKYMAPPETSYWDAVGPILVLGLLARLGSPLASERRPQQVARLSYRTAMGTWFAIAFSG